MTKRNALAVGTLGLVVLALPQSASAGLLDTMQTTVQGHTAGWLTHALGIANATFLFLAGLFFVYILCKSWMSSMAGENHISLVLWPWGQAIYYLIIPACIVQVSAAGFLGDIIGNATTLSGMITGDGVAKTPDGVFAVGLTKAVQIIIASLAPISHELGGGIFGLHAAGNIGTSIVMFMIALLVALVLIVTFTLLACEMLALHINVWIAISIGAVNLGFLGSPATAHIAQGYINAVWISILRLVALVAWIDLCSDLVNDWAIMAATADIHTFLFAAFELLAASIGVLFLTLRIGSMIDHVGGGGGGGGRFTVIGAVSSTAQRAGGAALRAARG